VTGVNVSVATAARVAAGRDLRDLWLRGRGLPLLFAYTVLLSVTSYLTASNRQLNFLEQREALNQTLQIAVATGALLVLITAADVVSGERDRGTLEPLLVTPAPREAVVLGKAVAALSLWGAAFLCAVPYVWYLGRGTKLGATPLLGGLVVGTVLALFSAAIGVAISAVSTTSRMSLSVGLFVLLALFAPTQLPSSSRQAWFGTMLLHADPFTSGLRYLGKLVVDGHGVTADIGWFLGPVVAVAVFAAVAGVAGRRLSLAGGLAS
jgi:ABC-2 type transport system permease protein